MMDYNKYKEKAIEIMNRAVQNVVNYDDKKCGRSKVFYNGKAIFGEFAQCGVEYRNRLNESESIRLMVIGKAVGDIKEAKPFIENNKDIIYTNIENSFKHCYDSDLCWIDSKGENQSKHAQRICMKPFFKLTGQVLNQLDKNTPKVTNWYPYILRSNLYKLTYITGKNPNEALKRAQNNDMQMLLKLEIEYYRPTHILFITGDWIDNFKLNDLSVKYAIVGRPERANVEKKKTIYDELKNKFDIVI